MRQRWLGPALLWALVASGLPSAVSASFLPDQKVTEFQPDRVRAEIEHLRSLADGLALTLAVCSEEPHCVTAMSPHEVERTIDLVQRRIDHLREVKEAGDSALSDSQQGFLQRYVELRERYLGYLRRVREVSQTVDAAELEKDWEELLNFEPKQAKQDTGPEVPEPNKEMTLKRFEDADEPLPVE